VIIFNQIDEFQEVDLDSNILLNTHSTQNTHIYIQQYKDIKATTSNVTLSS